MKTFFTTALLVLIPTIGMAQEPPDPFTDYAKQTGQPEAATALNPQQERPEPAKNTLGRQTSEGTWTTGLGTMFSYSNTSNELATGDTSTNSNYLLRLDAGLSRYLSDQFEIGVSAGLMLRRLERENGNSAAERDWLFQARTNYIFPVVNSVGISVGLGLGGYFGDSERPVTIGSETINETTSTYGLATDVNTGVIYGVSDHIQLRLLVNFSWLYGNESIPSANKNLSVSTTQLGLALGLNYVF